MIPHRRAFQLIVFALAMAALYLMAVEPAGAQAPQQRCKLGALAAYATQPPTYARCDATGRWFAISEKDYTRLATAQQARQTIRQVTK